MEGPASKKTKEPPKKVNHRRTSSSQTPSPCKKHIKEGKGRHRRILTTKEDMSKTGELTFNML
jgi:hypothetical protein